MNMKEFFSGVKDGFKKFGYTIGTIINSVLLSVVYLVGVGFTYLLSKLLKKSFLDNKLDKNKKSYWSELNLEKKNVEDYFKQF